MNKSAQKLINKNNLASKTDLKATENRFSNKLKETEDRLNKRIDRVLKYIKFEIEPLKEFNKEMREFKNKVLDRLDWLIGKYEKFEQEYTVEVEQNRRILDKLENHENRINKIEKSSATN